MEEIAWLHMYVYLYVCLEHTKRKYMAEKSGQTKVHN